jgi:hypothetical protein
MTQKPEAKQESDTTVLLAPDAARLIDGLRDTGYQFNTAVADIIDNSVAAEATTIKVDFQLRLNNEAYLRIWDDGIGMNEKGLVDAMQYGAPARVNKASLGKFGLGLKTASTAFCRSLTVVSRSKPDAPLKFARWDVDHVKSVGKWELQVGAPSAQLTTEFEKHLSKKSGTLVCWDKVDRILAIKAQKPTEAKKAVDKLEARLRDHLSMVFQRYLDPKDKRARTIKLFLNSVEVNAWDPFCIGRSSLEREKSVDVDLPDGSKAAFQIRAYILPRKEEFAQTDGTWDKGAWEESRLTNANQGIYVYRHERMIHGPDWLGLSAKEPHFTLFRVEFSFDHRLDDAFQVDIKKSQIILNERLREWLTDFLTPLRREADDRYRKGVRKSISNGAKGAHDASNKTIESKIDEIKTPTVKEADAKAGTAVITNASGEVRLKLSVSTAQHAGEIFVQPVDSILDGLLWEPAIVEGKTSVRINKGHPYYSKVYVPNLTNGTTIQGMDALLWGLTNAEMNCVSDSTKRTFEELRFEVSRNLRKLVEDLPEPEVE